MLLLELDYIFYKEGKILKTANFKVDLTKCIGCGICVKVCPGNMVGGNVLLMENGHPKFVNEYNFSWKGCWKCEHCLAICPNGAISILGINADEVSKKPSKSIKEDLPKLMKFRRSCRDFKKEEIAEDIIDEMLEAVSHVPTGGNNQGLEFTVVYTKEAMRHIYQLYKGNQLSLFDDENDDFSELRVYDAPHLFIAHKALSERFYDGAMTEINIATAYFELLANAYGFGTIISTYSAELLSSNKEILKFLRIPENHKIINVVGFGYPKYQYQRGVKKIKTINKIK